MSIQHTEEKQTPWAVIAIIIAVDHCLVVIYYYVIAPGDRGDSIAIAPTAVAVPETAEASVQKLPVLTTRRC